MNLMDEETLKAIMKAQGGIASVFSEESRAQTMSNIFANIPTISDHLQAIFSSGQSISKLAEEVEVWKQETPENKHLVLNMRTPDGRIMDVGAIRPSGWQMFIAEGYIDEMPCKIVGHIATLLVFCSYEETKGKSRVGFTIKIERTTEPQPEFAPIIPDKGSQTA
jgi:hypothetical protein